MERVKKALQLVTASAVLIGMGFFIAIFTFGEDVIALFLNAGNEAVLAFAVYGAKLYAFAFLVNGLNIVVAGYFTAIGIPRQAVLVALSKGIVWVAAGIAVLPVLFGVHGIWLTVPIAEFVTVMLSGGLMYKHFRYN
ncbi:MAG: multi antimicrobial extrusion protein MatE [Firmicutes bacterium]|nr:multi antimicrobial extrusion protein MatE [Bacillota bacterium]